MVRLKEPKSSLLQTTKAEQSRYGTHNFYLMWCRPLNPNLLVICAYINRLHTLHSAYTIKVYFTGLQVQCRYPFSAAKNYYKRTGLGPKTKLPKNVWVFLSYMFLTLLYNSLYIIFQSSLQRDVKLIIALQCALCLQAILVPS